MTPFRDLGQRRPRRAVALSLSVVAALGLTTIAAPAANAGNCDGPLCGRVWNWTNSTIRLASLEGRFTERCTVRAWPTKEKITDYKKDGKTACKTVKLGPGGYSGDKLADTDAFTFGRKFSLGGHEYSAGTFVKINNLAQVICANPFNTMPRCKFLGT